MSALPPPPRTPRLAALRRDAKCLAALAVMRVGLSTLGYNRLRRLMPPAPPSGEGHFYARQLARRIERLAQLVPRATCLTQALALQYLLARAGHGSDLHVGVRCDDAGRFEAHAWLACNGRVVIGAAGTRLSDYTHLTGRR
ncbi:lasso peptide biosynthesis B2 protein [Erythrobacter sp. NE805]|uniref:lasso peptide biosynthesis B2 protein n=1 Tax=Erythrobacter sp. NE805 TaxID=3389875 RepID=UPI00396B2E3C